MASTIGKDNIALEKKKQSALTKAVKKVTKGKGKVAKPEPICRKGIIVIKHIPHGFYENEMKGYFSQFGKVRRVVVARSKKTGKSRGYGFVEFEFEEVAKIAAEAMNNYLMFERLIKCEVVGPEVNPKKIFKGRLVTETNFPKLKARKHQKRQENQTLSAEENEKIRQQRLNKLEEQNKRLAELGIEYQFPVPQTQAKPATPATKIKSESPGVSPKLKSPGLIQNESVDAPKKTPIKKEKISDLPRVSPKLKSPGPIQNENIDASKKTPSKKDKISDLPRTSPKLKSPGPIQNENIDAPKKTPGKKDKISDLPRISPKLLRSRKSMGPGPVTPAKKDKTSDLPKISPKLLRSRKSMGTGPVTPVKKETISDLPKISPKLLRSKKSKGPGPVTPGKKDNISDLPKISPKLLRSRKSDGSGLTPLVEKVSSTTAAKPKKAGRKSVL